MTEMFSPLGSGKRRPLSSSGSGGGGDGWEPILPVPADAPAPPAGHYKHGKPSATYVYRSAAGELLGYVYRIDLKGGGKEFAPLTFCKHSGGKPSEWRWKGFPDPRPLYGLDRLARHPDAPVVVCEGEKAADAAQRLLPDYVAVTSPNGSKSARKAGWGALARRQVIIWPDADEPGASYADGVARALKGVAAASVAIIAPPPGVKAGWDAADAEADGWGNEKALALVCAAKPAKSGTDKRADDGNGSRNGARDNLMVLAEGVELWPALDGVAWATIPVGDHREHWPVKSERFREWLSRAFYQRYGIVAGDQPVKEAISTMAAQALHDGKPECPVFLRVGALNGEIWLDLADQQWRAVRIHRDGWEVVERPPVKFRRPGAMRPLPEPLPEATVDELREMVNVATEGDLRLVLCWLVAAMNPNTSCPILAINGEQGSAKSTTSTLLRQLIDPNTAPIRAAPSDEQDFMVAAHNSHVLVLDNLSGIPGWQSDALCRLTTGGGFVTRKLFTDYDEVVLHLKRPVILNGIPDLASRPDLADRCIMLTLPAIPENQRRTEAEFWEVFNRRHPHILGALLTAMSAALRRLPSVDLAEKPRMADFAMWAIAAEESLGLPDGGFIEAYTSNRSGAVEKALEADSVAEALHGVLENEDFEGTATALLALLEQHAPVSVTRSNMWPKAASLRNRLRRLTAPLRSMGIVMDLELRATTKDRSRLISIRMVNR